MCDCYVHGCNHKTCSFEINMHLGDFETGRDEIEVFCGSHIPKERCNGVLWQYRQGKAKSKIFIKCLTLNAKKHWKANHKNGGCDAIEIFGKKV